MMPIPPTPVFCRAELRPLGWSNSAIGRAVTSGALLRLRHDQFTLGGVENPRLHAIAAARDCSGSAISHRSASLFYDVPLLDHRPFRPDLTVQPWCTGDVAGALLHRAALRPEDVVEIDGVLVTTPARTAFDLARHLPLDGAVVAFDFVLQKKLATMSELEDLARFCRTWPNTRRAMKALRLCDGRAESALESVSRLVLRAMRVPTPELQVTVFDELDVAIGRLDFYWDEFGVMGEADGRGKYDARPVLTAEKERQEQLEDLGLVAVRWGWSEARSHPQLLRQRIYRAFERGARLQRSGSPRRWSV